ncbi:electron transfer flavoprotein subunit alpha [Ammoniphilus oxalaticus]|uniref:Electron transfer flavoprotein subunit alpha n=1 Tax=Ammoniphilus oxalaticus TaxID=66863 RepID=A0A419SIP9_9BACL|nr:electron transfer flavoprotein subunit alpha/FixB family protein [Ammoniphilus oxalaticus]RKD23837.1 electron transfer flavoprotein subunit alpha [Ammoniphilus oxalaticus]
MRNILALGEIRAGALRNISFEMLSAAQEIAEGGKITAVLIGCDDQTLAHELGRFGADQVYFVTGDQLSHYTTDGYLQVLHQLAQEEKPDILLFGHTAVGRDIAPRLASRLGRGLVSDVTDIQLEAGKITFTRPIYAGKAFQQVEMAEDRWLATIRPNNMTAKPLDSKTDPTIIDYKVETSQIRTIIKEIVKKTATGVDLSEAKVVVAGGRGVKSAAGFEPLQQLADLLGGAVGASRGACDADYCDYSLQIGQTGKVVTPDLYIACGISGAIQHLAGMSQAKVIVAINKDPDAPIFEVADYGIVGDLFEIVPLLTEELKTALLSDS